MTSPSPRCCPRQSRCTAADSQGLYWPRHLSAVPGPGYQRCQGGAGSPVPSAPVQITPAQAKPCSSPAAAFRRQLCALDRLLVLADGGRVNQSSEGPLERHGPSPADRTRLLEGPGRHRLRMAASELKFAPSAGWRSVPPPAAPHRSDSLARTMAVASGRMLRLGGARSQRARLLAAARAPGRKGVAGRLGPTCPAGRAGFPAGPRGGGWGTEGEGGQHPSPLAPRRSAAPRQSARLRRGRRRRSACGFVCACAARAAGCCCRCSSWHRLPRAVVGKKEGRKEGRKEGWKEGRKEGRK